MSDGLSCLTPAIDKSVSAFLEDVNERGLNQNILLVITGDFGRTLRINKNGGRDHWGNLCTLAVTCGWARSLGVLIAQPAFLRPNQFLQATCWPRSCTLCSTSANYVFCLGRRGTLLKSSRVSIPFVNCFNTTVTSCPGLLQRSDSMKRIRGLAVLRVRTRQIVERASLN